MKSRDNLLRLKHFQVEDKTRQLAQIDMMISEFERMYDDLGAQVKVEEEKAGITDKSHFAYPTFAKAALTRQENLEVSIRDLKEKRVNAEAALNEAEEELKKAQSQRSREGGSIVVEEAASEPEIDRRAMIG